MDQTTNPISASKPALFAPCVLRGLVHAAAVLWVPTALPMFVGPLTECGHCVRTYVTLLPLVPGILAMVLVRSSWGYVLSAVTTLVLLAGLAFALRRMPRGPARALAIFLACCSAAQALLLGYLLRM